jgi:hypothetical protein
MAQGAGRRKRSRFFFPRTAAWDALKRSLKGQFERGNELMVVKDLAEAR